MNKLIDRPVNNLCCESWLLLSSPVDDNPYQELGTAIARPTME